MSVRKSVLRWNHILNRIEQSPCSKDEIYNYLDRMSEIDSYDYKVSSRTFPRDIKDIQSIFKIDIEFDRSLNTYKIDKNSQKQNRLLEAFNIINVIRIADENSSYLNFENRKSKGTEHFNTILQCIKKEFTLKFSHRKFIDDNETTREIEPYALKEFNNRWYLVGKDLKDGVIKNFGLDRITELSSAGRRFIQANDFDIDKHFEYSFGIVFNEREDEPQDIELSFSAWEGKYIKALPLHHSQKTIVDTEDEFRIKLKLYPSYDFCMKLLSYGKEVTVIIPQSLKDEIIKRLKDNLANYD